MEIQKILMWISTLIILLSFAILVAAVINYMIEDPKYPEDRKDWNVWNGEATGRCLDQQNMDFNECYYREKIRRNYIP